MPYIKPEDREKFHSLLDAMHLTSIKTAGELNFLITCLVHSFLAKTDRKYQNFNDALGALEGAKLELYRRAIASYEEKKIKENGDV